MERAGPVSGTVRLVAQLGKMFNFIRANSVLCNLLLDYILQFLKKLKLYTKLCLETLNIRIKIYLRSFVDFHHLQKYFYNWNITLNHWFIFEINSRGCFIWKCLWLPFFCPLWKTINWSKSYVSTVPMIMSFKVLKYFSSGKIINMNQF